MVKSPNSPLPQSLEEKRKFLNFVLSNSIWKDGKLTVEFKKYFSFLADTIVKEKEEQGSGTPEDQRIAKWQAWRTMFELLIQASQHSNDRRYDRKPSA